MTYKPAREIRPKRKGYRGKEPFLKTGDMIHWDSFLERNFIRLADFDQEIQEIYHQPVCIYYTVNGKKHRYYPDFKMISQNNRVTIVEVKTERFFNKQKNILKYEVGRRYCEEMGWDYKVFTEREIDPKYLQWNLSLLRHLGTRDVSEQIMNQIAAKVEEMYELHLFELREACEDIEEESFYAAVYQLIYLQDIQTDLVNYKISDDSFLRIN
ncbi:TnsA endonuclease N-terminal domain-containing protein [Paenibacillus sp. FSL K6-2524]|uniref:TnsA endonuclease N-terminal domain-containing protein n=1 Tax=Paenibacillus sp. FSL K6-2524 TaxID=2954516 RepID=UPI0030F6755D